MEDCLAYNYSLTHFDCFAKEIFIFLCLEIKKSYLAQVVNTHCPKPQTCQFGNPSLMWVGNFKLIISAITVVCLRCI